MFKGEVGLHLPLHILNHYSATGLIQVCHLASRVLRDYNFAQVWVSDVPEYRHTFVLSGAIAATLPTIRVGTAVTSPYGRSPIDLVDAFATLSELTEADEVSAGIGAGAFVSLLGAAARASKPIDAIVELMRFFREAFENRMIEYSDFLTLCTINNLKPDSRTALRFRGGVPIKLYYGSHSYRVLFPSRLVPLVTGFIIPHNNLLLYEDQFGRIIEKAEQLRRTAGVQVEFKKILHLTSCVSTDSRRALDFSKRHASHVIAFISDEKLTALGFDLAVVNQIRDAFRTGKGIDEAVRLTTDEMVRKVHVVGTPAECMEQFAKIFKLATLHEFDQLNIGVPVGPDLESALNLWSKEILPSM